MIFVKYGKLTAFVLLAALAACPWRIAEGAEQAESEYVSMASVVNKTPWHIYENDGWRLSIPDAYKDRLYIDVLTDGVTDFFTVCEEASMAAAQKEKLGDTGAGWLFTLGRVPESRLHEILCGYMTGADLFARDGQGNGYIYYHPTDVRYVRENRETMIRDQEQWSELCEWAAGSVKENFIKDNPGLTAFTADNSDIGICIAQVMYQPKTDYRLGRNEEKPLNGDGFSAVHFGEQLLYGVDFHMVDRNRTPDGDYIRLNLPRQKVSLDFFTGDGCENLVREVRQGTANQLYQAKFQNETFTSGRIMTEWMETLQVHQDMKHAGCTPDSLLGNWAEKMAGRGVITINRGDKNGIYDVQIQWGNSAYQTYFWHMTAKPVSSHSLHYTNGKLVIHTFSEDGAESEVVKYENGTGTFILNSANEIMWQDDVDHAGSDTVFISI